MTNFALTASAFRSTAMGPVPVRPSTSDRCRWHGVARMGFPDTLVPGDVRQGGGTTGIDDDFAARGFEGIGAWILGRNMFGPLRGPWADDQWKGWWGDNPPYHTPVFVLTHHARPPIEMEGGTTFSFCDRRHPRCAAAGAASRRSAGRAAGRWPRDDPAVFASRAGRHHAPGDFAVLLGSGESLLADLDLVRLGYRCSEHTSSDAATHVVLTKS